MSLDDEMMVIEAPDLAIHEKAIATLYPSRRRKIASDKPSRVRDSDSDSNQCDRSCDNEGDQNNNNNDGVDDSNNNASLRRANVITCLFFAVVSLYVSFL